MASPCMASGGRLKNPQNPGGKLCRARPILTNGRPREDTFQERLPIAKELKIGRFILKIDSDGPVFTSLAASVAHGSSLGQMVGVADDPKWGNACPIARGWGRRRGVTTKSAGMWESRVGWILDQTMRSRIPAHPSHPQSSGGNERTGHRRTTGLTHAATQDRLSWCGCAVSPPVW